MTPEAQQIAIAKACDWKDVKYTYHEEVDIENRSIVHWSGLTGIPPEFTHYQNRIRIPDYLNDLNAMAEAEKVKEMAFDSDYAYWLARIAVRDRGLKEDRLNVGDGFQIALTATAAQKAEALLRALNLWKEDSK